MQGGSNPNNEGRPKPLNPSLKTQDLRVYKIILIIEIAIIAVLAIAIILVKIFYHTPSNLTQASDFSICKHRTKEEILNLASNITKDEAISIIENMNGELLWMGMTKLRQR